MSRKDLPSFDNIEQDDEALNFLREGRDSTETIDLDVLLTRDVSTSGSFHIRGDIWATTFGKLTQALPIPAILVGENYAVVGANQACKRISDTYEEIMDTQFARLFPDETASERAQALLKEVFSTRKPQVSEGLLKIGSSKIWGRMSFRSIRIAGNRLILIIVEDLTSEKRKLFLERKLQQQVMRAKKEWENTFDSVPDLILILDKQQKIIRANKPMAARIGMPVQKLIGRRCHDIFHGSKTPPAQCPLGKLKSDGAGYSEELFEPGLGGHFEISVSPLYDDNGRLVGSVHVARDITGRKQVEQERDKLIADLTAAKEALHYRATHDGLTGLHNRSAILYALKRELARSDREARPVGVIIGDIDKFKSINDEYGHLAGDAVLRGVAERFQASLRPYDWVGRYGGEEFVIVIPGCDRENAIHTAERLRHALMEEPLNTNEGSFDVRISFGVTAVESTNHTNIDDIIRTVDRALYRAKSRGGNCTEVD